MNTHSEVPRKPAVPRRRRWAIPALIIAALVGGWWGWHHVTAPAATAAATAGELVPVTRGLVETSVESSGKVVSNLDVDIKCRASGEIIQLPFDISMHVKKDDLLCQLDPTDEKLALRPAESAVAQAQARVAQSKFDVQQAEESLGTTKREDEATLTAARVRAANLRAKADRSKVLLAQNLTSVEDVQTLETDAAMAESAMQSAAIAIDELHQQEIQVDSKREAIKTAEAQLVAAQVTADAQTQQLKYTTVQSPIDGVVSALNVQKGAIIASGVSGFSGGTTILTLSDLSHVFVTATVDESDIGNVKVGQQARITVASFPNRTFDGVVTRIATKGVNASNVVTFEVKVEVLDEHKDLLGPEMTGVVKIILAQHKDVLMLPAGAIVRDGSKTFVTSADGQRTPVTLGLQGEDLVEIVSGVKEGQQVIVAAEELPSRWKPPESRGKGSSSK